MIRRYLLAAGGALAGLYTIPVLAELPYPYGPGIALVLCAVIGMRAGWRRANHLDSQSWTAQRCWEILGDDRNAMEMQERAGARLARLGRGVVADPSVWWPWRKGRLAWVQTPTGREQRPCCYPFEGYIETLRETE